MLELSYYINIFTGNWMRWRHDYQLNYGWRLAGFLSDQTKSARVFLPNPINPLAGQTWPMRDAEAISDVPGGKQMFDNDLKSLAFLLMLKSVRNFYGFSHGGPTDFAGYSSADIQRFTAGRRFRFVFLDGCQSLSSSNAKAFGLDEAEVDLQDQTFYLNKGLTPSAFMGNIVPEPAGYPLNPPVPYPDDTNKFYAVATFDTVCNWQGQFFAFWTSFGLPAWSLTRAKAEADRIAWGPNSYPIIKWVPVGRDSIGQLLTGYDITQHLKIGGFGALTFNQ